MPKKTEPKDTQSTQPEQVQQVRISDIHPFKNHPFKVVDDALMQETVDSIMQFGVLNPTIIRPDPGGGYEMVAGHRRLHASGLAGKDTIPAIVRNLTDDEAVILLVDTNLQRENISPIRKRYLYRAPSGSLMPYAKAADDGLFFVKDYIAVNGHQGVYTLVTPKGKALFLSMLGEIA